MIPKGPPSDVLFYSVDNFHFRLNPAGADQAFAKKKNITAEGL
jgi:hypothetical protein